MTADYFFIVINLLQKGFTFLCDNLIFVRHLEDVCNIGENKILEAIYSFVNEQNEKSVKSSDSLYPLKHFLIILFLASSFLSKN